MTTPITMPRLLASYAAAIAAGAAVALAAPMVASTVTYNPETVGMWIAGYGVELSGPDGFELVHCRTDAGPFAGVDC